MTDVRTQNIFNINFCLLIVVVLQKYNCHQSVNQVNIVCKVKQHRSSANIFDHNMITTVS